MTASEREEMERMNRKIIEEAIANGKITKCPPRWAIGAVSSNSSAPSQE